MGYVRPTDAGVTSSWADHKYRGPPSAEPGTDYGCAYGTDMQMAGDGTVSDVDWSPDGGEGRRVSIDLDDGSRVSYIHLSQIYVQPGWRVSRGQYGVCLSGASGYNSDWYYGPHVHTTNWEYPGMSYADSRDFENYVSDEQGEIDMTPEEHDWLMNVYNGVFYGGPSLADGGRPLHQSLADLLAGQRPPVLRNGENIAWLQELADIKTILLRFQDALQVPDALEGSPQVSTEPMTAEEPAEPARPLTRREARGQK